MIRLLFVGDGDRDAVTNPPLVERILGTAVEAQTTSWARVETIGRGYDRRLLFALAEARSDGLHGVVAVIDQDKSPGRARLKDMEAARTRDRETSAPLPTALGCADPHAEVWLLDDEVAVRTVLQLDKKLKIPNVRKVSSPKNELTGLHSRSPRVDEPVRTILGEIAATLESRRCSHTKDTGFAHFQDEVRTEIGPLAKR